MAGLSQSLAMYVLAFSLVSRYLSKLVTGQTPCLAQGDTFVSIKITGLQSNSYCFHTSTLSPNPTRYKERQF